MNHRNLIASTLILAASAFMAVPAFAKGSTPRGSDLQTAIQEGQADSADPSLVAEVEDTEISAAGEIDHSGTFEQSDKYLETGAYLETETETGNSTESASPEVESDGSGSGHDNGSVEPVEVESHSSGSDKGDSGKAESGHK